MQHAPAQAPDFATASDFSRKLGLVLRPLSALVAARFRVPGMAALVGPLCHRINRALHRVQRLMTLFATGQWTPPRPRRPHQGGPHKPRVLPTGRSWLIAILGWEAAGYASQLETLLAEPEAVALLARIPAAARILAPIRHMLSLAPHRRRPAPLVPPPPKYQPLPQALDPQWGRPPECETWHRWSISPIKPSWP